jgi:hypothetical protein
VNPEAAAPKRVSAALRDIDVLVAAHGPSVWTVSGTLSGWRVARNRWGRGDICETSSTGDGIASRLPIAIPPALVTQLRHRAGGEDLPDGSDLRVTGRIEVGDRWNPLRLVASAAEIIDTESDLIRTRRMLTEQLRVSGALDRNRTLVLPDVVARLGLVAASSGEAGRRDFLLRLGNHPTPVDVVERRTAMSGPSAPTSISAAIDELTTCAVEAIVVCRGGGAASDLSAFDAAPVATAIARCSVPIILGVGHSTDRTIADLTAHTSVATPTAAADVLVDRAMAPRTSSMPSPLVVPAGYPVAAVPAQPTERPRRDAGRRLVPVACVVVVLLLCLAIVAMNLAR